MKSNIYLLTFLLFTISCSKSALVPQSYKQHYQDWYAKIGHDQNTWDHAIFCLPEDSLGMDTIRIQFTDLPGDSAKFMYQSGSEYFIRRIQIGNELFNRDFAKLKVLITEK